MTDQRQTIAPQPGFQTSFLSSRADIVIGGGAAGAGKSYALLMEPLRHSGNPKFRSVIFRRTMPQIKNEGGLWDTSKELYLKLRDAADRIPKPTEQPPKWRFPSGATLLFSHLEMEDSKLAWDGAQVAMLGFDELIHFTESQFWYLVSRNRSTSGVLPYVRCTTNPQTSGWVKRTISWWIYPDDHENEELRGMPIPERAGVVRFAARHKGRLYWGDTAADAIDALPEDARAKYKPEFVKSITFIPGLLSHNAELTKNDPGYEGNLLAQDEAHGDRLLRGCWYDATGASDLFRYEDLYDMFTNATALGGEDYLSADIAMEGSDAFRVGAWNGLRLYKIHSWQKVDGDIVMEKLKEKKEQHHAHGKNIVIDVNGVGNFLKGTFRTSFDFRSQSVPLEVDGLKVNYKNLRTQCIFKLAELVKKRQISILAGSDQERDMIIEECEAHKKTGENEQGKLTVTSKQEVHAAIHRSPDYFDMIMMRMVFEIKPRKRSSLFDEPEPEPESATT